MAHIMLRIFDKNNNVLIEKNGIDEVTMVYAGEYQEGDYIELEVDELNSFYHIQFDDVKGKAFVYLTGKVTYIIPFGEQCRNSSSYLFKGNVHLLSVKKAFREEVNNYRNLAENVWDQPGDVQCYPHVSANAETRGDAKYVARNAIDGVVVTEAHGPWPYESWGINKRDDAALKLEFGRSVEVEKIVVYCRAHFPHDNWWVKATLYFSDGSKEVLNLEKTGGPQCFDIRKKGIKWIELTELIKSDSPSLYPALTQLQVYGRG